MKPTRLRCRQLTEKKTSETWVKELNAARVPCGPIYSIDQMFADAQVEHLKMAQDVPNPEGCHVRLVGQPMTLSRNTEQDGGPAVGVRRRHRRGTGPVWFQRRRDKLTATQQPCVKTLL
jgi:crotonobetainyl-CoA:carnitine CoA-transferase CaiB-like acyl-CoA transferase